MDMMLNNIVPPKKYWCTASLQNEEGNTLAMIYAIKKIIPPKELHHDPTLQNKS